MRDNSLFFFQVIRVSLCLFTTVITCKVGKLGFICRVSMVAIVIFIFFSGVLASAAFSGRN